MGLEVHACLLLRKWQDDFAGPKRTVTSKAAHGIQSNQRHSTGWGGLLHKSWYIIDKQENQECPFTHSSPCNLHHPHLHPLHRQPMLKGQGSLCYASERIWKYSHHLRLLISAHLPSEFGLQPVHTLSYLESIFFSLSIFEVNIKYLYFIYFKGQNHKHSSSGILGGVLHPKTPTFLISFMFMKHLS